MIYRSGGDHASHYTDDAVSIRYILWNKREV